MLDVVDCEVELVIMGIGTSALFGSAIGEDAQHRQALLFIEGQHLIIQHVGGSDRCLGGIKLGLSHLGIGVDISLLVDPTDPFHGADIEGVLSAEIAGMCGLDLGPGFVVELLLLQGLNLRLREDASLCGNLGFERLEPRLKVRQIVPQPDGPHPAGRDEDAALAQLIGNANLAVRWLLKSIGDNGLLGLVIHPVLQVRNPPGLF